MSSLTLVLRTLVKTIYEGPVDSVYVKTELGEMEILPGHATLVGVIGFSRLFVHIDSRQIEYFARQGSVAVDAEGVVRILATDIQETGSISIDSVQSYLTEIDKFLSEESKMNEYQKNFLQEQRNLLEESLKHIDM